MKEIDIEDKIITFRMEGKSFDDGFDLYNTLTVLQNLQNILDKAYLTLIDKERMSKKDRQLFKIKVTEIKKGSFLSELMIYAGGAMQLAYPIVNAYSPSLLFDLFKEGYTYLTTILQANRDGKKVNIHQSESGDNLILVIEGNNYAPINIRVKTFEFVKRSFDDFKNLTSQIDGENVKKINITDKKSKKDKIEITSRERELFTVESRLDEKAISFIGEIFRIDTHAKNGKLLIHECEEEQLKGMELNFELILDKHVHKCCKIIDKRAEFVALKKMEYDPITLKEQIKSLKIIEINSN
ncbi:hypothetical protein SAMN02745135_01155 [Caloranaerobacter azorensis DSM 13643]|uniref:Uncharacterized protein n=1 Tax=Caloranaerobacter azorensis DSM 13643 TaxID=1121264 RepID=A0A1M5TVB8_9FIRM|nr:hypothetical protein [Caloranaerobacter azorensis]SHH54659.1 hypothetical protein SAMN02745135_01155 [Caloranaerobacter azorensis DSM 13643]